MMKRRCMIPLALALIILVAAMGFYGCGQTKTSSNSTPSPSPTKSPSPSPSPSPTTVRNVDYVLLSRMDNTGTGGQVQDVVMCLTVSNAAPSGLYSIQYPSGAQYSMVVNSGAPVIEQGYGFGYPVTYVATVNIPDPLNFTRSGPNFYMPAEVRYAHSPDTLPVPLTGNYVFSNGTSGQATINNTYDFSGLPASWLVTPQGNSATTGFNVTWTTISNARYFIKLDRASSTPPNSLRTWTSDDMRGLDWSDENSLKNLVNTRFTTATFVRVPGMFFQAGDAVLISAYAIVPDEITASGTGIKTVTARMVQSFSQINLSP